MNRFMSRFFLLLAASLLLPLAAHAQAFRTYVASYGVSTNPCTVSQPCRLVSEALPNTLDGGEIWILDSANFNSGTLTINKSVSIMAVPGQIGSIVSVGGAPAISIATASAKVRLRNLFIVDNANNHGTDGINVSASGVTLTVESCVMWVIGDAVVVNGSSSTLTFVNNRVLGGTNGVRVRGGAAAEIVKSDFANVTSYGVWVDASIPSTSSTATVRDSTFNRMYIGLLAWSQSAGASARLYATGTSVTNASYGLMNEQDAGAATSTAGGNAFGNVNYALTNVSGTLQSFGNNMSNGNYGTITAVPQS